MPASPPIPQIDLEPSLEVLWEMRTVHRNPSKVTVNGNSPYKELWDSVYLYLVPTGSLWHHR